MSRLFGVVLAAGEGRRMGSPKADLALGGGTLLEAHAHALERIGCVATALVVRRAVGPSPRALVVPAITASPAESLAAGLRALDAAHRLAPHDRIVVTPVDILPPSPATFAALFAAMAPGVDCVTPVFAGRSGHPVVLRFGVLARYLGGPSVPLRDVVRRSARARVDVFDPAVLGDFDTPEDWARVRLGRPDNLTE